MQDATWCRHDLTMMAHNSTAMWTIVRLFERAPSSRLTRNVVDGRTWIAFGVYGQIRDGLPL